MRFTKIFMFVALLALVVVPAALALRFTDDSFNTPIGLTGQSYSHTFNGAGGCGPALPYQYRILAGGLPPGLSLSSGGTISGVPQRGGSYAFWVELSDENPPSASWCAPTTAQREFTITILQGLNIQQNSLSPRATFLNAPYSFQLSAEGGGPQTWSVQSGTFPPGLNLSSSGLISGTPTAEGDFTFVVKVADGARSDTETFTLTVVQPLVLGKVAAARAEVGLLFALSPAATGGRPTYTWSIAGDQSLPAGLTFDAASGAIAGKPTLAGTYPLKLTVRDQLGLTQTADVNLVVASRLTITKAKLKGATVGSSYKARFRASGGVVPRRWYLLGGIPGFLPAGIKLNRRTGELSGTPTKAGTYRLRMQVVDKLGAKSSAGFVLKVAG